ncbi:hypothetical protein EDC96DRAFT_491168 [Choanephora cucurbitarum]|nr:hypothetical protein EDC96DRAFT_491168 [Choanephora cucurbitarum]
MNFKKKKENLVPYTMLLDAILSSLLRSRHYIPLRCSFGILFFFMLSSDILSPSGYRVDKETATLFVSAFLIIFGNHIMLVYEYKSDNRLLLTFNVSH